MKVEQEKLEKIVGKQKRKREEIKDHNNGKLVF